MWHQVHKMKREVDGTIVADIVFPPESEWFHGHFPGDPLVPAVAQLVAVREVWSGAHARPCALTELKRIKFRAMVRPGDTLALAIGPQAGSNGLHSFRLSNGPELVVSGFVGWEGQSNPIKIKS